MAVFRVTERSAHTARSGEFPTTHWGVVLAAEDTDSPEARAALEELCRS